MTLLFETVSLPRYITPETDPAVPAMLDLYEELIFPDGYKGSPQNRRELTLHKFKGSIPYVARQDEEVVAFANFDLEHRLKGSSFLEAMVVKESVRNKGVGRFVVGQLIALTHSHGLERLRLEPYDNDAAAFYTRLGFEQEQSKNQETGQFYMSINANLRPHD